MFDFKDDFAAKFAEMLQGFGKNAPVPTATVCKSKKELADWFTRFALACRSNYGRK